MKGKYNSSNDSLFSLEFKIPYEKNSIEEHLEESQEEINFIKVKLTEAYEKLEFEIKTNTHLEEENEALATQLATANDRYNYERKENAKLKETLELILKNRKLLNEEMDQLKDANARKIAEKDAVIDQLHADIAQLNARSNSLSAQLEEANASLKDYAERIRQDSHQTESVLVHREVALANRMYPLTYPETSSNRKSPASLRRSTWKSPDSGMNSPSTSAHHPLPSSAPNSRNSPRSSFKNEEESFRGRFPGRTCRSLKQGHRNSLSLTSTRRTSTPCR